jgi:hypothetical protein
MIIDVIDATDPEIASGVPALLSGLNVNSTQLTFNSMCNGVGQLLVNVQGVANAGDIDVLRIWAHGMPGAQMVSGGQGYPGARNDYVAITADTYTVLAPLAPLFSPSGWAELRGCEVGAGQAGGALLLDLASMWNVPVYGGEEDQYSEDWSGPVVCAMPSGAISTQTTGPSIADSNTATPYSTDPNSGS